MMKLETIAFFIGALTAVFLMMSVYFLVTGLSSNDTLANCKGMLGVTTENTLVCIKEVLWRS